MTADRMDRFQLTAVAGVGWPGSPSDHEEWIIDLVEYTIINESGNELLGSCMFMS